MTPMTPLLVDEVMPGVRAGLEAERAELLAELPRVARFGAALVWPILLAALPRIGLIVYRTILRKFFATTLGDILRRIERDAQTLGVDVPAERAIVLHSVNDRRLEGDGLDLY
jgi:hypothetical protein